MKMERKTTNAEKINFHKLFTSLDMRKHRDPKCCSNWKQTAERCPKFRPSSCNIETVG